MAKAPSSLLDAINEDPNRFLRYLNLNKISRSKDPYKEFQKQMRSTFGSTRSGLNMWKYLKNSYKLQNELFKGKDLQSKLPKEYKGAFKKKQFQTLLGQFTKKPRKKPELSGVFVAKKTVSVGEGKSAYTRIQNGKIVTVKTYARTKSRGFSTDEIDFLTRRIGDSPREVMKIFNKTFHTNRTFDSIRTKLRRLK